MNGERGGVEEGLSMRLSISLNGDDYMGASSISDVEPEVSTTRDLKGCEVVVSAPSADQDPLALSGEKELIWFPLCGFAFLRSLGRRTVKPRAPELSLEGL